MLTIFGQGAKEWKSNNIEICVGVAFEQKSLSGCQIRCQMPHPYRVISGFIESAILRVVSLFLKGASKSNFYFLRFIPNLKLQVNQEEGHCQKYRRGRRRVTKIELSEGLIVNIVDQQIGGV